MDKSFRKFLLFSGVLIGLFIILILFLEYIYQYSTINTYNIILLIFIRVTIIITSLLLLTMFAIYYSYRKGSVGPLLSWPVKIGLKVLLPFVTFISGLAKGNKDFLRKFYVDVNNVLVRSQGKKCGSDGVLILLPHCLQNSGCGYKITNDIGNCRRCGKCCIGDIVKVADEMGVEARVVTGGTAARIIVKETRPEVILSVACERDLALGIADVGSIPVLGIINERPQGPCYNTTVNPHELRERLKEILK